MHFELGFLFVHDCPLWTQGWAVYLEAVLIKQTKMSSLGDFSSSGVGMGGLLTSKNVSYALQEHTVWIPFSLVCSCRGSLRPISISIASAGTFVGLFYEIK